MSTAEIIILVVGAILFTVSFFIPDRGDAEGTGTISKETEEKIVKEMLNKEISNIKQTIEDAAQNSIDDNRDKMERAMDRITNEKMMAINEYSDNVLEKIHKNHEEAVFLYDMLNNKHSQVKTTAAELGQLEKNVRNIKTEAEDTIAKASAKKNDVKEPSVKETPVMKDNSASSFEPINAPVFDVESDVVKEPVKAKKSSPKKKEAAPKKEVPQENDVQVNDNSGVELMFASDGEDSNNNKDRIIALHDAGKSNMAIAKELGLGIGEVKLVLDLYQA